MSHLTPDQVLATPAGDLAERSGESLFQLKSDAADLMTSALLDRLLDHVETVLIEGKSYRGQDHAKA